MFTGLVDDIGTVERVEDQPAGRELRIRCGYESLSVGESVAVNGACLTIRACGPGWFSVGAVVTTLRRTAIGAWSPGKRVNLERALRMGDRLGGHLVQGHVDGLATVQHARASVDTWLIDMLVPHDVGDLLMPHGSIAVDGVSLTVNALPAPCNVQLSVIDHTMRHTTLGALVPGDEAHIEADVIGKYVRQLIAPYQPRSAA